MKKILFAAHDLDLGGIETALVTLANYLVEKNYDVTIALEKKEGEFLQRLQKEIHVIEYNTNAHKNIVIRKLCNLRNRLKFIIKYRNQFDFSASFATYSLASSFMARTASQNSALWCHADYLTLYHGNKEEMRTFFKNVFCDKFKHIVFVSKEGANSFIENFPDLKDKVMTCNNLINGRDIIAKSKEPIEEDYIQEIIKKEIPIFLNVGRHDERQKKLTRIIEASKKLKEENHLFKVLFIGDGKDTKLYQEKVKEYHLEDTILFLGRKENPYPYFRISDCVILSSEYEGYPVVYLESFVLNKPMITTKVSDYEQVENGRGMVVEKDTQAIYIAMKQFLQNGYEIKDNFDYEIYNANILRILETIM